MHVLVVDDNSDMRDTLGFLLRAHGVRADCAANGQEALDYLHKKDPPSAIVLDLNMPVMDGWQFRQEQLRVAVFASIPVVLVSSEAGLSEVAGALQVEAYLTKPIEPGSLLDTIRRVV